MIRTYRRALPLAAALLAVLIILPTAATEANAATTGWTANCAVRLRTSPSTQAAVRRVIQPGAVVKATRAVRGGSWSANCQGSRDGRYWLRIVSVNGRSTQSLFGRGAVYAAYGLFRSRATPAQPTPTPTPYLSNCSVRLRATASTAADTREIIGSDELVTATGTVTGSSWAAECGTNVSGNSWYRITAVRGRSVSSLYGVSAVYAAAGLFRAIPATSGYAEGIDVSKWQGTIDWVQVRAAGKRFVIAKATEGYGYTDPMYGQNKAGARAQGLEFGAYHYARPDLNDDALAEADWFVDTAAYERGMLIPTLDLEVTGGKSAEALTAWVRTWVQRVDERLGIKPMIYVSPYFWRTNMADTTWFADNGYRVLWIAHWGVASPNPPGDDWAGASWTFWQYTSDGRVPGISGRVDLNRYRYDSFDAVRY
jgi:lysozyme